MAQPVNVLVMIHGMRIERDPFDYTPIYTAFWKELCKAKPDLKTKFQPPIGVVWGHDPGNQTTPLRPDQHLTEAQRFVGTKVDYDEVKKHPGPNNEILGGFRGFVEDVGKDFPGFPVLRNFLLPIKENIFLRGFGDAIYYCSPDGEPQVRRVVYQQVLEAIDQFDGQEVRLHLFGHSLGVTLTHDFLYGLFGSTSPDFMDQGTPEAVAMFKKWKARAGKELKLGTLVSAASQLPLFIMRKQSLIDGLYGEPKQLLNPEVIGIRDSKLRWLLFYDADDVLGYPSRGLYDPNEAIKEVQVGTGSTPETAHNGYWTSDEVIKETARLLSINAG